MGDAINLLFKKNSFDTAIASEILEHVSYDKARKIIKECKRVAKRVLITVPISKKWAVNPEHKWIPDKQLVINLLDDYNYNLKETKNFIYCIVE